MAELIPLEYRMARAQKALIRRWGMIACVAAVIAAGGVGYAFKWQSQQRAEYDRVNRQYAARLVKKIDAKQTLDRRAELARRMETVQQIQQDDLLLSLLQNVTSEFSEHDLMEHISIQAHARAGSDPAQDKYYVKLNGDTISDSTRADLLDRLTRRGKAAAPPMLVSSESTSIIKLLDGEVVRFQIACDPPPVQAATAPAPEGK